MLPVNIAHKDQTTGFFNSVAVKRTGPRYTKTLVVVNLILVNFFCFLVITRHTMGGVLDDPWRNASYQPPGPFSKLRGLQITKDDQFFSANMFEQKLHDY